jgi:predicted Rossmann fold flavoprotein
MKYDIAIIGGGPAGLMAAGRAGELGAKVVLIEKNERVGVKLLLTGGGRCNISNDIENPRLLADYFGPSGRFLISAFNRFGVKETKDFFSSRGLKLKTEKDNQIFPASDRAQDVLEILINHIKETGGEIKTNTEVRKIIRDGNKITRILLTGGGELEADNYIIASGGQSYPLTGSTGDAYRWLKELGHTITAPRPALVPIFIKEHFIKEIEGLSFSSVAISLYKNSKKIVTVNGPIIFTFLGLSGPAALNLSRYINPADKDGLFLTIDFLPDRNAAELDEHLRIIFQGGKKLFKNSLAGLVPPRLNELLNELILSDGDKEANAVTKEERKKIIESLKSFRLAVSDIGGFDQAMVTAGGVALTEVDPKTMRSKIITNLFFAGEILDLTGPTGGYNLQLSWSTGSAAAAGAAAKPEEITSF